MRTLVGCYYYLLGRLAIVTEVVLNQNLSHRVRVALLVTASAFALSCNQRNAESTVPMPREIVDLGALVTEDLSERISGKRVQKEFEAGRSTEFEIVAWSYADSAVSGQNSYYTFANHSSGPHVDAPNHVGVGGGLDSYPVEAFAGRLRVIDVSHFEKGRTVTAEAFEQQNIQPADIVVIYTGYTPPTADDQYPEVITLTRGAAEYLANLPVRAFGTDAASVHSFTDETPVEAETAIARAIPVHHAFLSRGIPLYEALFHVEQLLGKENLYFVGPPINVKDGDGMLARPYVLVY